MQTTFHVDTACNSQQQVEIDETFNGYEIIIFLLSLLVLTSFFIIAVWSGILLIIGKTDGGGPLGILMNALHIQLLL